MPLPGAPSQYKSFKMMTCDKNPMSDYLTSTIHLYTQPMCGGVALPYTSMNDIPSGCHVMGGMPMQMSCQNKPMSLTELWPAMDIYLDDETCDGSSLTMAIKPGCFQSGEYGYGMECMAMDTLMALQMFDSVEACAANVPSSYLAIPTDLCLPVGMTSNRWDVASKLLKHASIGMESQQLRGLNQKADPPLEVTQSDGEQTLYYKARCNGY
jgi:hypothetical protein